MLRALGQSRCLLSLVVMSHASMDLPAQIMKHCLVQKIGENVFYFLMVDILPIFKLVLSHILEGECLKTKHF